MSSETGLERRPLVIRSAEHEAQGVRSFVLADLDGRPLPSWQPGAHLDVILANGLVRQYSLCGSPADGGSYRIAVLREPESRGGSAYLHDGAAPGDVVEVRGPRNHFALASAPSYLFVAGGIGITPILPMLRTAGEQGAKWHLIYGGRGRNSMSFLGEIEDLAAEHGGTVEFVPQDEAGYPDLESALRGIDADTLVYSCGPPGLLTAMTGLCDDLAPGRLHLEHFSATLQEPNAEQTAAGGAFEVELRGRGVTLTVAEGQTILAAVRKVAPQVLSSCEEGFCGTCETPVLEGVPDHRDTVLSDEEKAANDTMMICVSRCIGPRLVLGL